MFDKFQHTIYIKYVIFIIEVLYMEKYFIKSLQMIKTFNIKNEKEYNILLKNYLILSAESLKYISQTRNFRKIIKLAREV